MQYTLHIPKADNYNMIINSSAKDAGGVLTIEVNGNIVKENIQLPTTQASDKWESTAIQGIDLPQGEVTVRFHVVKEGSNLLEWSINDVIN